ncbi:MAG: DUF2065 domain-containing protein [Nitrospinae bacterium]|nr:DUF2065 domain-containing protein [Nitrospinota bacterium]
MGIFICAVGLMMVFEGIPFFCFPSQVKRYMQIIPGLPNKTLRTIGLTIIMAGLLVAYVGKSLIS